MDEDGEDVTAPKTKKGRYLNQSFLSMIASVSLNSNGFETQTEGSEQGDPMLESQILHKPETLANRLADMFGIQEEKVVAEYPCCLLQDITQPGYMYLLEKHICFYAYLPRRSNKVAKSGFLYKRGRQNPRYNRYWFVLKGDALSYYKDRSQLYFPRDTIDLRSGLSASSEDGGNFSIHTQQSRFQFRAETEQEAQEWLNQIQTVNFRSRHTGDSVKICIPLQNILEVEDVQVAQSNTMLKMKVVADETFTIDEYFFSLSDCDQETIQRLQGLVEKVDVAEVPVKPNTGSAIPSIYQAGAALRRQSKRVGSLLANESRGYYDKVTTMWSGKKLHYDDDEMPVYDIDRPEEGRPGDRFRQHFALPETEKLQATYYTYMQRGVPVYGKIYVGSTKLCFRSLVPGSRTKMILPFRDVENVAPEKGFRFGYAGLVVVVRGHEEIFFEFRQAVSRDDCAFTVLQILDGGQADSRVLNTADREENDLLEKARAKEVDNESFMFDEMASILDFRPQASLNVTCLTIGSRGDVQPYIALCKGLMADGHRTTIATHAEFEPWIRGHGIDFRLVAGDPAAIMALCVENDMFTPGFLREGYKFRSMLADIFVSAWEACQGAELLIESPSTMAGIHIAERLQIPYFRAFTMPWTRTRAFPHAFAVLNQRLGGNWNWYSYSMLEHALWTLTGDLINTFRQKTLKLGKTTLRDLQYDRVPFLYNFSPSVVAPPLDFPPQVHITGYWFLDEGKEYEPPADLVAFISKARADGKPLVYVGFGSVTLEDPASLTRAVSEAVIDADVRCILCKGWSDRMDRKDASVPEIPLHDAIFQIKAAPHDWLFRQMDAAAHHGGAGTTGASLRAGKPTLIKPFFGDQHFFASRVEDLGVGIALRKINSRTLAHALRELVTNKRIIARAKALGARIQSENGVQTAISTIYRDLEYAKSLIQADDWTTVDG